jgi:hypothetical protein
VIFFIGLATQEMMTLEEVWDELVCERYHFLDKWTFLTQQVILFPSS